MSFNNEAIHLNGDTTIDNDKGLIIPFKTGALSDPAPTLTEITDILGNPNSFPEGYTRYVHNALGGTSCMCISDGSNWYYIEMVKAV